MDQHGSPIEFIMDCTNEDRRSHDLDVVVPIPGVQPAFFPLDIEPAETHSITVFLTNVKAGMPYFECFPQMVNDIFNRATTDHALLQTILSVSHLIADSRMGRSL